MCGLSMVVGGMTRAPYLELLLQLLSTARQLTRGISIPSLPVVAVQLNSRDLLRSLRELPSDLIQLFGQGICSLERQ